MFSARCKQHATKNIFTAPPQPSLVCHVPRPPACPQPNPTAQTQRRLQLIRCVRAAAPGAERGVRHRVVRRCMAATRSSWRTTSKVAASGVHPRRGGRGVRARPSPPACDGSREQRTALHRQPLPSRARVAARVRPSAATNGRALQKAKRGFSSLQKYEDQPERSCMEPSLCQVALLVHG